MFFFISVLEPDISRIKLDTYYSLLLTEMNISYRYLNFSVMLIGFKFIIFYPCYLKTDYESLLVTAETNKLMCCARKFDTGLSIIFSFVSALLIFFSINFCMIFADGLP